MRLSKVRVFVGALVAFTPPAVLALAYFFAPTDVRDVAFYALPGLANAVAITVLAIAFDRPDARGLRPFVSTRIAGTCALVVVACCSIGPTVMLIMAAPIVFVFLVVDAIKHRL